MLQRERKRWGKKAGMKRRGTELPDLRKVEKRKELCRR